MYLHIFFQCYQVVVLVTEGSEESKLRNSNSKSKSITKALQTRKDKFDLYGGDDPMVPPGPKPRMVQQAMAIEEYHLSQVLFIRRKRERGGGGGGEGGGERYVVGVGVVVVAVMLVAFVRPTQSLVQHLIVAVVAWRVGP